MTEFGAEGTKATYRPAFAISIDHHRCGRVHGLYWPDSGGVWVSFKNAAGETRRQWASVDPPTAGAYESVARIVLCELVEEEIAPPDSETVFVRLPEAARPRLSHLKALTDAMEGVIATTACCQANTLCIDVQLSAADRVAEAIASAAEAGLDPTDHVIIRRMVRPAPRNARRTMQAPEQSKQADEAIATIAAGKGMTVEEYKTAFASFLETPKGREFSLREQALSRERGRG